MVLARGISSVSFELYGTSPSNISLLADFLLTDRLNFYWDVSGSFLRYFYFP
jgi:hypothetical protein